MQHHDRVGSRPAGSERHKALPCAVHALSRWDRGDIPFGTEGYDRPRSRNFQPIGRQTGPNFALNHINDCARLKLEDSQASLVSASATTGDRVMYEIVSSSALIT